MTSSGHLGLGIGWRPEIALWIERRRDLGFVEVVAENLQTRDELPEPLIQLRRRGLAVIPHGISLSLGSAARPDPQRLAALGDLALKLGAPLVSEHLAFVRAGELEAGHLLPVPRTREALDVVVENVRIAQQSLPVPLAIENISTLVEWPEAEMDEATFLAEFVDRTGVDLLLDIANIHANAHNHAFSPRQFWDRLPLERIAYVHVGGGVMRGGLYHDTHAHAVPAAVYELLEELAAQTPLPGVMLERDDDFPSEAELNGELDRIAGAVARGAVRREKAYEC